MSADFTAQVPGSATIACSKTPHWQVDRRCRFRSNIQTKMVVHSSRWRNVSQRRNFEFGLAFLLVAGCGGSGEPLLTVPDGPATFYRARGDIRPDAVVTLVSADARTQLMVRLPEDSESTVESQIDALVIRDGKPLANVSCRLAIEGEHVRTLHSCGGTAAIPAASFTVPRYAMIPESSPEEIAGVIASTAAISEAGTAPVQSDGGACRAGCDHRTLVSLIGCLFQNPIPHCFSRAFQSDVGCYVDCRR
ncbi:MAG TPA: hypothetical protein VFT22_30050 [Kofleriaceae bacterium]|nr:hypothetical protein [Kofleriaceae bacterium]